MLDGNLLVFDTETISTEKRFIYNIGYVIVDPDGKYLVERDMLVRQVYDNKPLFETAYYANKRPLYLSKMKGRQTKKVSWGEACRVMLKDIKQYHVLDGFAFNSPFDVGAFYFTHNFFGNKRRPLDGIKVHDIRKLIKVFTETEEYKEWCKANGFLTAKGRPQETAEVVYAYITANSNYVEEHTALEDSRIETEILEYAIGKIAETPDETESED